MNISGGIGRVAISVAVAVAFSLARRYMPASELHRVNKSDASRFSQLQWLVGGTMVAVGVSFGFATYALLVWANRAWASRDAASVFQLLPDHSTWFFFPFFGAICLAWEMTLRLWIVVGNASQAQLYESWSNAKTGFRATLVLRLMALVIAAPIGLLTLLAVPIHTSIGVEGLTIGHFGAISPRFYSYSDLREITVTKGSRLRDGSLQRRPAIVLEFADGTRWSSADNRDPQGSIEQSLLSFLQSHTGLPISYIDAFPFGT